MVIEAKDSVIKTSGLTKIFRDFWGHQRVTAVEDLNLVLYSHEVYGLLGPNGSGKSTTIKMLLGLLFPTRGVVKVLSQSPGNVKTNARIGYLPEESYLYPFLNARETLDFYGRLFGLGRTERRRRIDSLLDMVGLSSVGRRPLGEFSKGMTRRIGLAQALINDPDLLILDEPTSGLDPLGTRQIKDLICELGRRGKTVLLCSHLLADVEDICDRIGILYGGRMQDEGAVDDLLSRSEMTQIRTARLKPDTIENIKELIHRENQDYQLEVQTPRYRLEDYFLQIVAQAQAADIGTSGAIAGTGVSDFLTSTTGEKDELEAVIEQLVHGREIKTEESIRATEPVPAAPITEEETVRRELLDSLVDSDTTDDKSEELTRAVKPTEITESETSDVDRSVIDSLIDNSSKKDKPSPPDDKSD